MADRKSVSAEDTIRLSIESCSSRVVCGVRCRPRKTSLCAALKWVKTFIRDARSAPELNCHLEDNICYMSTV